MYRANTEWWLVTDACPAVKANPKWGSFISSYRIHWEDVHEVPFFEGAQLCTRTGINRAELLAIVYGLQAIVLGMESEEYAPVTVNVLTDSQTAFSLCTGEWSPNALAALAGEADRLCDRIRACGANAVWFHKAGSRTVKPADTLGRAFKNICDMRLRRQWKTDEPSKG